MKHLGDITKIDGHTAPVVDVVIGGSPCQDLSVAGCRAGLAGERSGLFMEQIRIVKEMREEERKRGRTGNAIRPRFMVWENVPGAFSSNKGKDFKAVLEEIIRIAEPDAPDIPVEAEKELAYRRTRVVAKLRGVGTTTAEIIRNVAASFSYGEVEVAELPSEYRVTVRFVGMLGLPPNLDDLKAAIGEVIPAHLEIVYITDLKVWNDVKDKTWGEMSTLTWEQMRGGGV